MHEETLRSQVKALSSGKIPVALVAPIRYVAIPGNHYSQGDDDNSRPMEKDKKSSSSIRAVYLTT
jgi:hypothetical protein